jgi:hypothetical protein
MASRNGGLKRLRNIDYSDRELLLVINSLTDKRGLVRAEEVATALGVESNGKRTPAGTVSVRMSWMRRYGYIDRVEARTYGGKATDPPYWLITDVGQKLMRGTLNQSVIRAIKQGPGNQLLIMRHLMRMGFVENDFPYATALRREYQNQAAQRRR